MQQYSIIFVLVACFLKKSLGDVTPSAQSTLTDNNPVHEVLNVNSKLLASLRTFVNSPINNHDLLDRVRREYKKEDCGRSKGCEGARQNRARFANNRRKSTTRMTVLAQYEPQNIKKRTTQKPNLVSFQYKKPRQGNRAVATYSQRGFAVACPDCAPGWQVLLSLEPAPPGRVPLSCLNCPVGWESLINITPPVSKPLIPNNKNNMKTNAPTLKNPNFVPVNGQTIVSNGKGYVPLGPIIGPGGLLYVPVSSATGTVTWNPNDWKVPSNSWDHNEEVIENEPEKGNKKTIDIKGKGTTKSIVVTSSGKKTITTSKPGKKPTKELEDEDNTEENTEDDEEEVEEEDIKKDEEEDDEENEDEKTTVKGKTTAKPKTTKGTSKTKSIIKSESEDAQDKTEPSKVAVATNVATMAATTVATMAATTAKPAALTTAAATTVKPAAVATTLPATTKAVAVTPATTTPAPAAPAAPALPGGITLPAGINLPAGVDPSSLMSSGALGGLMGGGGGGLGGMLGGFLGPKPTTIATTRVDPGKAGLELGFDMGEDK